MQFIAASLIIQRTTVAVAGIAVLLTGGGAWSRSRSSSACMDGCCEIE